MRRHMQNLSFIATIGVLLSFAFFFSQQINNNSSNNEAIDADLLKVVSLEDIPDCSADLSDDEEKTCYANAATLSESLVEDKAGVILSLETDTGKRMAFMETQSSWEESRNADCAYIAELAEEANEQDIARNACLRDRNLERLSLLVNILCEYYDPSACTETEAP